MTGRANCGSPVSSQTRLRVALGSGARPDTPLRVMCAGAAAGFFPKLLRRIVFACTLAVRVTAESFTTRLRGIDDDQYLVRLGVTDANHRQQPREAS